MITRLPESNDSEDSLQCIKNINYEELEDKYDIIKYYPKYIHNGVSTPRIRDMLGEVPIYKEANKHVRRPKKKQGMLLAERQQELKQQQEIVDSFNPYACATAYTYHRNRSATTKPEETYEEEPKPLTGKTTDAYGDELSFRNPFEAPAMAKSKSSLKEKSPVDLVETITYPLKKSQSYDQTKSVMTNERKQGQGGLVNNLKNKLLNRIGRKYSIQPLEVLTENVNNGHTGEVQTIQYTQSQMVGHGSFGVVFQTQILPSNEIAAMKRVLQDKRFKNRELQIMKLVHHRNIADLKYYFYTNNDKNELYLNLILEFVPETLYKALHYYVSKRLQMPPLEVKLYTYQMLRALNYIHSQGICHRDIKPQNLLINPDTGELKLCDFGSAKILNPSEPNVSYICSRYYRAPELIFGATNYTTKIDVWSAGCVMAELILGQPLFPGESGIDQLVEIIKILGTPTKDQIKNMNPNYMEHKFPQIKPIPLHKIFKKISTDCIQFLARVLQYSPVDRLSCVQALVDPYFDELRNQSTKLPNYRKIFSQQYHHLSSSNSNSTAQISSHSNNANHQIYSNQPDLKELPQLFDFNERELSAEPSLNARLVPEFAMGILDIKQTISSIDEFIPMTPESMKVTLE